MRCNTMAVAALAIVGLTLGQTAQALNLLAPGDFIISVNEDQDGSRSNHPAGEAPANAINGALSKYLNFARASSGIIVTPAAGASTVQSLVLTTANDAEERDPTSYLLYGTNDAITNVNNSPGGAQNWTLISSGPLSLPTGAGSRNVVTPAIDFANANAYTSYRLSFPTVRGPGGNSMQIAEVQLFTGLGATGSDVLVSGDPVLAIANSYPEAENPAALIDNNTNTKFLNFGKENTGVIVTPSIGPTQASWFTLNLANDSVGQSGRDPVAYEVYGTNDAIASIDDSQGDSESWTLINSGSMTYDPVNFGLVGPFVIDSDAYYTSYKFVFPTLRNAAGANSLQISELQIIGSVPEPATYALLTLGLVAVGLGRRALRRAA